MPYTLPGPPTARAGRRRGDLQDQTRRKARCALRRDRRRVAFQTLRHRYRIVREYRARRQTNRRECDAATHTAERFGISTRSVRRFDKAVRTGGKRALMPCYHIPPPPRSTLSWPVVGAVLALRAHLGWCGQRIVAELAQRSIAELSHTTVYRLLRRYHCRIRTYHPIGRRDGIRYRRQRVRAPNWTWHVDFAGPLVDADGVQRSLVVVVDSYSRMLLALDVVPDQKAATVECVLAGLFARYGTPRVVVTDNGPAFAPPQEGYEHRFSRLLASHGVEHRRTKPYYPQTNGKAEAMVKTAKRELLGVLARRSLDGRWRWAEVAASVAAFVGWYNFYRAHGALGYAVPASWYAGVSLPKPGLSSVFGLVAVPVSDVDVASLPVITAENRTTKLALALP